MKFSTDGLECKAQRCHMDTLGERQLGCQFCNQDFIIPEVGELFLPADQDIGLGSFDGLSDPTPPPLIFLLATMNNLSQVSASHSIGVAFLVQRICKGLGQDVEITNDGKDFLQRIQPELITAALLHDIGKFCNNFIQYVTNNSGIITGEERNKHLERHPAVGLEWFARATDQRSIGDRERTLTAGVILLHHFITKGYPKFSAKSAWGMAEKEVCTKDHEFMLKEALEYWMVSDDKPALDKIREFINNAGQLRMTDGSTQARLEALCILFVSGADIFESLSGKRAYQRSGDVPSYLQAIREFEEFKSGFFHTMHRLILQDDSQGESEENAERSVRGIIHTAVCSKLHSVEV